MKHLGVWLAGGVTFLLVLAIGIFSFLPTEPATQPTQKKTSIVDTPFVLATSDQVVMPTVDTSQVEATLAQREGVYQEQIAQLDQTLQERQLIYQNQIQDLAVQITNAQNRVDQLIEQEQELQAQISQLEAARAERLTVYQSQLQQAQDQYNARYTQLQAQLNEIQSKLAEANAQLGR